jgi:hypothetical protein
MIATEVALDAVPDDLFADQPFQLTAAWWRCVLMAGLPTDGMARFLQADDADRPAGLLPLLATPNDLTSLVTPYSCLFQPILAPGADPFAVGQAFGRACAAHATLRLDALDPDWPAWPGLLAGLAAAGWRAAWFDSFGNWHDAAPHGWDAYLDARSGPLRTTIRRKLPRAERDPALHFTAARAPAEVAAALADYDQVYARSWKPAEPYPAFNATLLVAAAACGRLRMGVLRHDTTPIAAQYWIVDPQPHGGATATVLKLAHDEAAKALSPGTVLTAWMIRALLAEGVTTLDFGRGDDPYKQLWVNRRRQRKGLILARLWRWRGAVALARQALGGWQRRWKDRIQTGIDNS